MVNSDSGSRVEGTTQILSAGVRKTIQYIKEIVGNHSDADIYVALKETNMDPNETVQKLLNQDPFHPVKRKRDKKKEGNEITSSPTPPLRQVRRRADTPGTHGKKKHRASAFDYREEISKSLANLVSAVNNRTQSIVNTPLSKSKAEIADCMRILEDILGTDEIGDLLVFALRFFQNKEHREYFTAMLRRDWQLAWLKMMYSDAKGGGVDGSK